MNTVVLLSGGVDSASCLAYYTKQGHTVNGLFIDYGQPVRAQEERCALAVAAHYNVDLEIVRCVGRKPDLTGEIPGRNALLAVAALLFQSLRHGIIALGIHRGTPYYDCSESFAIDLDRIMSGYTNGQVSLGAPFLAWDKQMIYQFAEEADVPVHLTWSCEVGPHKPCGSCLSCRDREALNVRTEI